MIESRNRDIVVMSQFNINGSRGKDAGKFISDYISRDSAVDPSMSWQVGSGAATGDGVAFTLDSSGISRQAVLDTAEHVQNLHLTGKRAIQQMVISFAPDYLERENLIDQDTVITGKGDYRGHYDDVRLRFAVRNGLQSLVDLEGYSDGKAIACIQWDTRHLHVHAVVYEDGPITRWHYGQEKGMLKESSLNQLAFDIDRSLNLTHGKCLVPSAKNLTPQLDPETIIKPAKPAPEPLKTTYIDNYLWLINLQQKRREDLKKDIANMTDNLLAETTLDLSNLNNEKNLLGFS